MIVLPLLAQLALQYVPDLLKVFVDDKTGEVAKKAADVVRTIGGSSDPNEAHLAITSDPEKLMAMKVQLADLALRWEEARLRGVIDMARADDADRAGARAAQAAAAERGSPLAWGAAVTSLVVLGAFVSSGYFLATRPVPEGSFQLVVGYFETIKTLATAAVFYWVGSSRGSAAKDERPGTQGPSSNVATTGPVTIQSDGEKTADALMDAFNRRGRAR